MKQQAEQKSLDRKTEIQRQLDEDFKTKMSFMQQKAQTQKREVRKDLKKQQKNDELNQKLN